MYKYVFMVGIRITNTYYIWMKNENIFAAKCFTLYVGPPQTKDALSVELGEFRTSAMNSLGNSEYNLQNAVTSTFSHFSNNFFT